MRDLSVALAQEDAAEARELVRGLVETITLIPGDGRLRRIPTQKAAWRTGEISSSVLDL